MAQLGFFQGGVRLTQHPSPRYLFLNTSLVYKYKSHIMISLQNDLSLNKVFVLEHLKYQQWRPVPPFKLLSRKIPIFLIFCRLNIIKQINLLLLFRVGRYQLKQILTYLRQSNLERFLTTPMGKVGRTYFMYYTYTHPTLVLTVHY